MTPPPESIGVGLELRQVAKHYTSKHAEVQALSATSFSLNSGEFVSLVGPSGCGKSTTLRLAAGLESPTSGNVFVDGQLLHQPRSNTGIAFQRPTLLSWCTVYDNIILPSRIQRCLTPELKHRAIELLSLVGLAKFRDHYPAQLSGGMQQRVSLARSLIMKPDLLLMDEPFGALDEFTREKMNEELLRLWTISRPTVMFITHSIIEAIYLSDRIVVMSAHPGRVIKLIDVDLPRPRSPDQRSSKIAFELNSRIRELLKQG